MEKVFETNARRIPVIVFLSAFFLLISSPPVVNLFENIQKGRPFRGWLFTIVVPVLLVVLFIYIIRSMIVRTPKITITSRQLIIGKQAVPFSSITGIDVRTKRLVQLFVVTRMEACCFIQTRDRKWYIPVESYPNGHLIRTNLEAVKMYLMGQSPTVNIVGETRMQDSGTGYHPAGDFQVFKKSLLQFPLFYFYAALIAFFLFAGVGIVLHPFYTSFGLFMAALFFLLLVAQSHYFMISNEYLVVKNRLLPQRTFSFKLTDITSLEVGQPATRSLQEKYLKIVSSDFKIRRFQSGITDYDMLYTLIAEAKKLAPAIQ